MVSGALVAMVDLGMQHGSGESVFDAHGKSEGVRPKRGSDGVCRVLFTRYRECSVKRNSESPSKLAFGNVDSSLQPLWPEILPPGSTQFPVRTAWLWRYRSRTARCVRKVKKTRVFPPHASQQWGCEGLISFPSVCQQPRLLRRW